MRCDLHVHTRYSGPLDIGRLGRLSRECYSEPWAVYETARRRGMDLVAITDHDSVEGALQLAHLPDFIVGEELTCHVSAGCDLHLGVWDLDATAHERLQERRSDPEALFAWLAEHRIPACVNHPFSPLTGPRRPEDLSRLLNGLSLIEDLNGMMPASSNALARAMAREKGKSSVGGSDAHTLERVAHAYTRVPGARNRSEFLAGLREGWTIPRGRSGSYAQLTADVLRIFGSAARENASRALISRADFVRFALSLPVMAALPLLPLATFASYSREVMGSRAIEAAFRAFQKTRPKPVPASRLVLGVPR